MTFYEQKTSEAKLGSMSVILRAKSPNHLPILEFLGLMVFTLLEKAKTKTTIFLSKKFKIKFSLVSSN